MQLTIKPFGGFRRAGEAAFCLTINQSTNKSITVKQAKDLLADHLSEKYPQTQLAELVSDSVLADQNSILEDAQIITSSMQIAVLPPVCGG